jgi:hypothetical protein
VEEDLLDVEEVDEEGERGKGKRLRKNIIQMPFKPNMLQDFLISLHLPGGLEGRLKTLQAFSPPPAFRLISHPFL